MIPQSFPHLWSSDRQLQNQAYYALIAETDQKVDWAYAVWDQMVENLAHQDNHNRAIAAQMLANLAKSDPQSRILADFDALFRVTYDDRFVTARHAMQALWKVGAAGEDQRRLLLKALETRFGDCASHKNCTLIRYDIIQGLRTLHEAVGEEEIRSLALRLIESEGDVKYHKKYAGLWKKAASPQGSETPG